MKKNVSTVDRAIRLVLAVVLIYLSATKTLSGPYAIVGWIIAGVFLLTAIAGTCPLYSLLGISSCPKKDSSH
jgi:hypothetical protein